MGNKTSTPGSKGGAPAADAPPMTDSMGKRPFPSSLPSLLPPTKLLVLLGINLLSFGPEIGTAQELAVRALDFDIEDRLRASYVEIEGGTLVGGSDINLKIHPNPLWLLYESLLLNNASYETQFITSALANHSKITHYSESGFSYANGKFYVIEILSDGKEYLFVIFKSNASSATSTSSGISSSTTANAGEEESHFLSKIIENHGKIPENFIMEKNSLHPSFITEAIRNQKIVILTGHSMGGLHAIQLSLRVLREFKAHSISDIPNFYCITYGSPVLQDDNLHVNFNNYRKNFYHYILENDLVAKATYSPLVNNTVATHEGGNATLNRSTSLLSTHTMTFPLGKVFVVSRNENTKQVSVKLLLREEMKEFYDVNWKVLQSRDFILNHFMAQYFLQLNSAPLFFTVVGSLPAPPATTATTTTAAKDALSSPDKALEFLIHPTIRNVYLTGFELEIEGDFLSTVSLLEVNGKPINFSVYSSNSIIGRLDRSDEPTEGWLHTSNLVNIGLTTVFAKKPDDVFYFKGLPLRMLGNSKVDMFPNELIAAVLPFTTLMLADESLNHSTNDYESVSDLLKDLDSELKKIESCIPVEFAFNMLTRNAHEKRDPGPNDSHKHMKRFLKRLREVEIIDWSKLCSTYMLRVLKEAIDYLSEVLDEDPEVQIALKDAFSTHTLVNSWFDKLYVSTFDGFCESIYVANQAVSNRHYWDFVYKKQIKVGITFTMAGQKAFEYIPFNEAFRLKTAEGIVLIEKESSEATKDEAIIFINKYKLTIPGSDEVQSFLHIEIYKAPNTPETKLWISKITGIIGKVIIQTKSEIKKTNFNSILVQSFDNFVLSTWFSYAWFLQYERDWPSIERINEINKILAEQIPLHQIDQFNPLDFKAVHDEIIRGIESTYGFNIGLYFMKHPKRKVLTDLKIVREEMLSNHYSVNPPFFSGEAVDFEVKDSTRGFKNTPFFNFIPKAVKFDENVKWEEVLKCSQEVTDGLEFMLLMLDRYVLLTRQELYQIRNTFKTRLTNAAIAAVQVIPAAVWGGYEIAKYVTDKRLSHVVNVEQRFRRMYDKIVFSDQQVKSYKELLMNLVSLLSLDDIDVNSSSIEMIEDVLYYSIPSAIGKYSLQELMVHAEEIFTDDVPVYGRWKELLNPRSKAVHLFIMKQIYHCHRLRMLRSKFITIGVNGQKNSGKSTLVQKVCGENYLPHIITGENPRESTIFPTGYRYPFDLPNYPPAMIIDLPGCTDADTENIVSLFCDSVDVSIFMISSREAANFNNSALKDFIVKFIENRHGPSLICVNGIDINLKKYPKLKSDEAFDGSPAQKFLVEVLEENRLNWCNSKALNLPKLDPKAKPMWACEGKNEEGASTLANSVVYSSGREAGNYPLSVWLTSLDGIENYPKEFSNYVFGVEHIRAWIKEVREYHQGWKKNETFQNMK